MLRPDRRALRDLALASGPSARFLADDAHCVFLDQITAGRSLATDVTALRGRSVLITTKAQLPTVLAALDLDGVASRILLCPPDLSPEYLSAILADGEVDAVVSDGTGLDVATSPGRLLVRGGSALHARPGLEADRNCDTEWVLFTSGTTGRPKMVRHTLQSLTGPLDDGLARPSGAVWSTFYDVRRYGGLQILLRALLGGASMVLSSAGEAVADYLQRVGAEGVTHISGTPSHWRRALMSPYAGVMAPAYVRLSGEIADQAILDRLQRAYPASSVAHAYASTEAGVAFDVRDGLAGFPASVLEETSGPADMRVEDGTLRIRSRRTATGYLGAHLNTVDGFVDTGDMVERRGDRYYFIGRKEGVINVGGEKVYPEEVEAVLNQHPAVRMSRVWARRNPIMGEVVAADIVLEQADAAFAPLRGELLGSCRAHLAPHKVPVSLRQVPSLAIADSGKLVRHNA